MLLTDYNLYSMTTRERAKYVLISAAALFIIGYMFFNNLIIAFLFSLGSSLYPKYKCRQLIMKRKTKLNLQFKDALYSLSSSLGAGRSLEQAFAAALDDLRILYPDEDAYIIQEFSYIGRKIELNEPVEAVLLDFAARSGSEDIKNFAETIIICKRSGGNLVQVVKNSSNIIRDKMEISEDIDMALAKPKYEQKLLNVMPLIFIALIRFGGSGYMDCLYNSLKGYLLMALALVIISLSVIFSRKILEIKV